jgi:metal-dependent amidase/aminoacylase/carboxypeptidase family protein
MSTLPLSRRSTRTARSRTDLDGPGGHTARPHLTTDLVTAAARVATDVPAIVARRTDARSGLSVTWGRIESGHAPNVIPQDAELSGTVRCLDLDTWRQAPDLVVAAIDEIANLHRAKSEINYVRGVPPVVNDPAASDMLRDAMIARRGPESVDGTEQSLGGEDFSWYLERVPGAMARLGVRAPRRPDRPRPAPGRLRRRRVGHRGRRGALHRGGAPRRRRVTGDVRGPRVGPRELERRGGYLPLHALSPAHLARAWPVLVQSSSGT